MNTQSTTPRTDAAENHAYQFKDEYTPVVKSDFARTLERELNAANERIKRLEEAGNEVFWALCPASTAMMTDRERDALKQWNAAKEAKP